MAALKAEKLLLTVLLLTHACGKESSDVQNASTENFTLTIVALRASVVKFSTLQRASLSPNDYCVVKSGERILLQHSPLLLQTANGSQYKIMISPKAPLRQTCRLSEGYVVAEDFRQEYNQVKTQTTQTVSELSPTIDGSHVDPLGQEQRFNWPVHKGAVTGGFGPRLNSFHEGIDVVLPMRSNFVASASGQVLFAGWTSMGYGNLVQISHTGGYETRYGFNSELLGLTVGKVIIQGDEIATSGSSGDSTGPQVHFEIRLNGVAQDPLQMLPQGGLIP